MCDEESVFPCDATHRAALWGGRGTEPSPLAQDDMRWFKVSNKSEFIKETGREIRPVWDHSVFSWFWYFSSTSRVLVQES